MFFDKISFGDFLTSDEKIARNILAARLEDLNKKGFLIKSVSPDNKSKFLYNPTQKAIDLVPLLLHLAYWSEKHIGSCVSKKEVAAFKNANGAAMRALRRRMVQE